MMRVFRLFSGIVLLLILSLFPLMAAEEGAMKLADDGKGGIDAVVAITTSAPGNVFVDSEVPQFQLATSVKAGVITYEVKDWRGQSIARGLWDNPGKKPLKIE